MLAKLVSLDSATPSQEIVIKELPSVLGRSSEADAHVEDAWASRIHCAIECDRHALVVRDLHSRNGTYVNGRRVEAAPLRPGDRLTVGASTFAVDYDRRLFTSAAEADSSNSEPSGRA